MQKAGENNIAGDHHHKTRNMQVHNIEMLRYCAVEIYTNCCVWTQIASAINEMLHEFRHRTCTLSQKSPGKCERNASVRYDNIRQHSCNLRTVGISSSKQSPWHNDWSHLSENRNWIECLMFTLSQLIVSTEHCIWTHCFCLRGKMRCENLHRFLSRRTGRLCI